MPCDEPIIAYRSRERNPETGKYGVTFNPHGNLIEGNRLELSCGKCKGCRIDRTREWAVRCVHESQMHPESCFITLTFSNDYLPWNYSIDVVDWQRFMKRLRKSLGSKKVRSFACGEYGEQNLRPHYHALIFGHDFNDKVLYSVNEMGDNLYTSSKLSALWPYGLATLGAVSLQSARYTAGYIQKKIGGDLAPNHYYRKHPLSGLWHYVKPEFSTKSLKPGLGLSWFNKFKSDCFPSGFVVINGTKYPVPQYYLRKLAEEEQRRFVLERRIKGLTRRREFRDPARREARATVRNARMTQHTRKSLKDEDQ